MQFKLSACLALLIGIIPIGLSSFSGTAYSDTKTLSANVAPEKIGFRAAIVKNLESGNLLYEKNPDTRIAPASLTKLMTLLLLFEDADAGLVSMEDNATISANAARLGGSSMGLRKGDHVRLEELAKGMAIASGNDAAVAVAEHLAGSEKAFVKRMNTRAKELGMSGTQFRNPHGLHAKGMYTTAADMLELCAFYLQSHPEALAWHKEKFYTYKGRVRHSANPLLGSFVGADGLKTGYVGASGYNLAATARRGDTRLVAVLLGARSAGVRQRESARLLEACFAAVDPKLAFPYVRPPAPQLAAASGQRDEDLVAANLQQAVVPAVIAKQYAGNGWWGQIQSRLRQSDELWRFCIPAASRPCREGYAIIRQGELLFATYTGG